MSDLRTDYMNDILAEEMNGKRRFKLVKADGSSEIVSIEDVTEYEQLGSLFGAGDLNKTNQVVNQVYRRPTNNNILINSNFANPVNQRGSLSVLPSAGAYTIDRWKASNISLTINNGYITAKSYDGSKLKLLQIVEFPRLYSGKTLTASLKYRVRGVDNSTDAQLQIEADGVATSTANLVCDEVWHVAKTTSKLGTVSSELRYNLTVTGKGEIDIEWAKLEEGEESTHYVPRLYAEEWLLCRRYFKKLYLGSSNLFQINTDDLLYCMSLEGEMRVPPTITFPTDGTTALAKNGVVQNGFTFEGVDMTVLSFLIRAKKTSHGISRNDIPTLRKYVYADSEL